MHAHTLPNRALSLILIIAMLTLLFAVLLPVAASADPADDIQNFNYQTSKNFSVGRATTEMRFVFTVGSLDYDEVGFVFSFEDFGNVATPTIGAAGCHKVGSTTVYRSITADGKTVDAPAGRYWVAAKVTDIPQDNYCGWIHVRAFVTLGGETSYSDAMKINPYQANRGEDEKIHELYTTKSDKSTHYFDEYVNVYDDVLDGGAKCFHPTNGNPTGNDLLIEYSVLWNNTIVNFDTTNWVKTHLCDANNHSKQAPLAVWSPKDGINGHDCQYAGGFEYPGSFSTPISDDEVTTPAGMVVAGGPYADYPNVAGANQASPEYGWHRIGFRYHEEVTNAAALKADATPGATSADYALTVTTYVDGVAIAKLRATECTTGSGKDCKLYTAESDGAGGIVYTDMGDDVDLDLCIFDIAGKNAGSNTAVFVVAEPYASCGRNFVQTVERVDSPESIYYRDGGNNARPAYTYYRVVD